MGHFVKGFAEVKVHCVYAIPTVDQGGYLAGFVLVKSMLAYSYCSIIFKVFCRVTVL